MPIEAGATYVFDLGYYDYGWWATLDQAGCRIVTRMKSNTPFEIVEDRPVSQAARRFPPQSNGGPGSRSPGHDRDRQGVAHLHPRPDRQRTRNRRSVQAAMGDRTVLSMGQTDLEDHPLPWHV